MNVSALDRSDLSDAVHDVAGHRLIGSDRSIVLRDVLTANYGRLHRRLTRHLSCSDLASECLHDAWLRLDALTVSACVQSPEAYVYRTACNVAMDRLRGRRSSRYVDADALEFLPDPAPGPEGIAEMRSDLAAIERAMERLPGRHRSVLVALRLENKTRQQVADGYHIPLTRVDTMLRQALDHCAEETGQAVTGGIGTSRRGFSQRWRTQVAAGEAASTVSRDHRVASRPRGAAPHVCDAGT